MKQFFSMSKSQLVLFLALSALLLILGDRSARAQDPEQGMSPDPSLLTSAVNHTDEHGHADDHIRAMEEARMQQNEFFNMLRRRVDLGMSFDAAAQRSCKFVSSIVAAPPAKTVALTFDDGPSSDLTPEVLRILKRYNIKATFFMKGNQAEANPSVVRAVHLDGHIVANHSWSHPNFWTLSAANQFAQVKRTTQQLNGYLAPLKLFRYPYGNSTCESNKYVLAKDKLNYQGIVGWHVDSCDWAYSKTGTVTAKHATICEVAPQNIANYAGHVLTEVRRHGGGIVLMHDVHTRTVTNLEEIIVGLLDEGYSFTNLDDPRMRKYFVRSAQ